MGTPLRVGVNSGSLPKHLRDLEFTNPVEALVSAATEWVELMHRLDFHDFKVSMKSTSVPNTIASNRLLSEKIDHPLHLGVTEAGTKWSGSLKSAVGLGTLLADGIGDTIRIRLSTFHAEEEVKVAWEILKALKLRERGPVLIACPTCGRLQFDMDSVVAEVERRLEAYDDPIEVSILGCAVNGIGEARHADFGITGAKDSAMIFSTGEPLRKVPTERLVDELFAEIDRYYAAGKRSCATSAQAAEAAAWLAENEDETGDDARAPGGARGRGRADARRGGLAGRRAPLHPRVATFAPRATSGWPSRGPLRAPYGVGRLPGEAVVARRLERLRRSFQKPAALVDRTLTVVQRCAGLAALDGARCARCRDAPGPRTAPCGAAAAGRRRTGREAPQRRLGLVAGEAQARLPARVLSSPRAAAERLVAPLVLHQRPTRGSFQAM